eukprot:7385891-Prymnesium_polylepis.1
MDAAAAAHDPKGMRTPCRAGGGTGYRQRRFDGTSCSRSPCARATHAACTRSTSPYREGSRSACEWPCHT